jgi:hypothetical protein
VEAAFPGEAASAEEVADDADQYSCSGGVRDSFLVWEPDADWQEDRIGR